MPSPGDIMAKILTEREKEKRKNEYNIQSVNKHLINILEENYYDLKLLEM